MTYSSEEIRYPVTTFEEFKRNTEMVEFHAESDLVGSAERMCGKCAFIDYCIDNAATLPEPMWHAMIPSGRRNAAVAGRENVHHWFLCKYELGRVETSNGHAHPLILLPQNRCLPYPLAAPFPLQLEPRCNTLDFASKVVCQRAFRRSLESFGLLHSQQMATPRMLVWQTASGVLLRRSRVKKIGVNDRTLIESVKVEIQLLELA